MHCDSPAPVRLDFLALPLVVLVGGPHTAPPQRKATQKHNADEDENHEHQDVVVLLVVVVLVVERDHVCCPGSSDHSQQ